MKSLKSVVLLAALALFTSPLLAMPQGTSGQTNTSHPAASNQTQAHDQEDEQNKKHEKEKNGKHRRRHRRHHRRHQRHHHPRSS